MSRGLCGLVCPPRIRLSLRLCSSDRRVWQKAARRNRNLNGSELCCCAGIPVALKCASVFRWACRKRRASPGGPVEKRGAYFKVWIQISGFGFCGCVGGRERMCVYYCGTYYKAVRGGFYYFSVSVSPVCREVRTPRADTTGSRALVCVAKAGESKRADRARRRLYLCSSFAISGSRPVADLRHTEKQRRP